MKFLNGKMVYGFFLLFFISTASADAIYRCDKCTESQKAEGARSWALANISVAEGSNGISKLFHAMDFSNENILSYKVTVKYFVDPRTKLPVRQPVVLSIATPAEILSRFQNANVAIRVFKKSANETVIPKSVISNPWEFVNCSYCGNVVQDYLRSELSGKMQSLNQALQAYLVSFGVMKESLPAKYEIKLESGGYIEVEISVTGDSLLQVNVTKVVDADSNTVPSKAVNLAGTRIFVGNAAQAMMINKTLNAFSFYIPKNSIGTVTISSCPPGPVGDSLCH